jgi:hypothetical protein
MEAYVSIGETSKEKEILKMNYKEASLTVEAALVLPLFLYFMIAFLYFIQIFTLQEQIQSAITKMGLAMAKTAYVYSDFPGLEEVRYFDDTVFGTEFDIGLQDFTRAMIDEAILKQYSMDYLDQDWVDRSCIKGGFHGISFANSNILSEEGYIDIVVEYKVQIPIKLFILDEMQMLQRVRLRSWTGYEVAATYSLEEEEGTVAGTIVYVTATGTVYHKKIDCTHIKLSVREVVGIPHDLRNEYGSKYDSCEACCTGKEGENATYYITSDGRKYHTRRNCSKIKRSVKEIPLSEVGDRTACKRCGN